jgi:Phosphodiester glycosidase
MRKNYQRIITSLCYLVYFKNLFANSEFPSIAERFFKGIRNNSILWEIQAESSELILILKSINAKNQHWMVIADPQKSRVEPVFAPQNTLKPISKLVSTPCKAGVNGGFFTLGASLSVAVENGKIVGRDAKNIKRGELFGNPTRGVWMQTIHKLQNFGWATAIGNKIFSYENPIPPFLNAQHPQTGAVRWFPAFALGGGPMLIYKNEIANTAAEELFDNLNIVPHSPAPRTAILFTQENLIAAITTDGRISNSLGLTISELSQMLFDLGASYALNLDGGASTTFVVNGEIKNTISRPPERIVYSGICFYE